ncbi:type II toxin-antitoxin system RelE/ParE family toxin [Oribacterium parvum]
MSSNYQYHFTKKAETDLDEILSYISIELSNPDAAASFLKDLQAVLASICSVPKIGRIVDNEFLPNREIRKSLVGNYVLYYLPDIKEKRIYVLRILYGRRNLDELVREINHF